MILETEITRTLELLEFPFMQRALIGGVLTGLMGGILGSFTILRQLFFFSDALGHSALLGISLGLLLGLNPSLILLLVTICSHFCFWHRVSITTHGTLDRCLAQYCLFFLFSRWDYYPQFC